MASGGLREIGDDVANIGTLSLPEELHQAVLNRCRQTLEDDLNFEVVMKNIHQKKLFDEVTICNIMEQNTTRRKVSHLIDQIKQRDQDTYKRFKECLIMSQQAHLKIMLEEVEQNVVEEMKEKHQGGPSSCLAPDILDDVPLEKHLNRLSMKIGKEYVQLGIELGVPSSRIEQIQMENPHIPTQCFKILQEWVQRDKSQATFRNLEKACRCVGIDVSILNQIF